MRASFRNMLAELRAVGQVREDALERDDLPKPSIAALLGDVEPAHPALAQQAAQPITAKCLSNVGGHVW